MKLTNTQFQLGFERLALCEYLEAIISFRLSSLDCLGVGATSGSKAINNETGAAYGTAIQQANQEFGDSNTAFNDLMTSMAPIAKAGPGQMGWTAAQSNAVNSQTINQTAAQYKNASAAVQNQIGAEGGGNIALPSGANIATEEGLAEAGAQQESSALANNTIANAAQGNANWQFAEGAIQKAPSMFATANQATGEEADLGKNALASQAVINAAPSWQKIAMGALGTATSMATAGVENLDTTGSSTGGEQGQNFLSGAMGAL
jgi:hypothetical protein